MPDIKKIRQAMIEEGISEEIISKINFTDPGGNDPLPVIAIINQMDSMLSHEQCLSVMEKQGCCKSGQRDKECKKFGKQNIGRSLNEKIELLSSIQYMGTPKLNEDGTITTGIFWFQDGVYNCACPSIKKLKKPVSVTSTYCGCCAGHFLYHYQNALQLKLKLKEIKSSPISTNGSKPCDFIFEVIQML